MIVGRYKAKVDADAKARAKKAAEDFQRKLHQAMVTETKQSLQKAIQKDATKAVNDGLLTGPIMKVSCDFATSADAADQHQATFSCLAVNKINVADGTEEGYSYTGTANYDSGTISWHLGRGGVTP